MYTTSRLYVFIHVTLFFLPVVLSNEHGQVLSSDDLTDPEVNQITKAADMSLHVDSDPKDNIMDARRGCRKRKRVQYLGYEFDSD